MQVQRVAMATQVVSWTVLGDDDVAVPAIEGFLAYLTDIGRSPNTVKAYAHDLKDYWEFLIGRGLEWREVRLEDVAEFAVWLRLPPAGRFGSVVLLPSAQPHVGASTVNRKLAALAAFYAYHARRGVGLGDLLTTWRPGHRGGWKPLLQHISRGSQRRRAIVVKVPRKLPRVLTVTEVQSILDACERLRDRFLFALLWDSGVRIGEALGMRHDDVDVAARSVTVLPRHNANGARAKSFEPRTVPVSAQLIRLWGDYLHQEYGAVDSDYLFVNLFAGSRGQAWSYAAAYDVVLRLRSRTGIDFDPHWFRHSMATRALRDGVPIEVVSRLLGHVSVTTTISIYGHLTAQDARRALEAAGWFTAAGTEVTL
jgi:site-specific recombinase XerD